VTEGHPTRFQFRLSTLLIVVSGCCVVLKLADAFGPERIIAALLGVSIGVAFGWWRRRVWSAVIGGAVAFWIPHWQFLIPGCTDARLADAEEYFIVCALGSLLATTVTLREPEVNEGEGSSAVPAKDLRPDRWGLPLWLLALACFYICASLTVLDFPTDRFGWGAFCPGGGLLFWISALGYGACLVRGAMIYRRIVSPPRRFPSVLVLMPVILGIVYLIALLVAGGSLSLQLTSVHHQNHWPAILEVIGLTLAMEVAVMITLAVERWKS